MRLLEALKIQFPHLSQKQKRDLIKHKQILWRGHPAKLSDDITHPHELSVPQKYQNTALKPNPEISIHILFEDDLFMFVNKPQNLHSVAVSFSDTHTVANGILNTHPQQIEIHPLECGLAHRLDFETSGVMVVAKTKEASIFLRDSFQNNKIDKIYTAITALTPPPCGIYTACVLDSAKSAKSVKLTTERINDFIITTEIVKTEKLDTDYKITVRLISGHRHQIRAHLALLGCPLKGDTLYGDVHEPPFALHAERICFVYQSKTYSVDSDKVLTNTTPNASAP